MSTVQPPDIVTSMRKHAENKVPLNGRWSATFNRWADELEAAEKRLRDLATLVRKTTELAEEPNQGGAEWLNHSRLLNELDITCKEILKDEE